MHQQELNFSALGRDVNFWLELDETNINDRFMMAYFERQLCYEAEIAWVLLHTLQEGDFAIDVGANLGFFTLFMSRLVGDSGKVFAFEPGADNLETLSHNLTLNQISNVQVIKQPVWCREEPVTFYINSDSRGSHALFDPANWPDNVKSQANPKPAPMDATTLDALDISKERVKVIKIDTEGAEQKILEGAAQMLAKYHPPYIVSELNPHGLAQSGCDNETFRAFMREAGYDLFFIHQNDAFPALVPPQVKVKHLNGIVISNVLFSTVENVIKAWPEATG